MKIPQFFALLVACLLLLSGCTRTIEGIQEDTGSVWHGTKHVIHEATEDDY